jgi:hypothetical protein
MAAPSTRQSFQAVLSQHEIQKFDNSFTKDDPQSMGQLTTAIGSIGAGSALRWHIACAIHRIWTTVVT